jgi:hypothetical protein
MDILERLRAVVHGELAKRIDRKLIEDLAVARHTIEQQDKIIVNLEAIAAKSKPVKRPVQVGSVRVRTGKNASYRRSVWLGVRESIGYAPLALLECIGMPIAALLTGIATTIMGLGVWILTRPILLISGLAGRLEDEKR